MQKKHRQQILSEIKDQILSKLQVRGFSVAELAKKYNLPKTTIYGWQKKIRDIDKNNKIIKNSQLVIG